MKKSAVFGMISGVISVLEGILLLIYNGEYVEYESCKGDEYTALQNTVAHLAHNLWLQQIAYACILISIGLTAIAYFNIKRVEIKDKAGHS